MKNIFKSFDVMPMSKTRWLVYIVIASFSVLGCNSKEKPAPMKVLNWRIWDTLSTMDPAIAGEVSAQRVLSLTYETLYQYSYRKLPAQIEPLIAEGMPEISADRLTYTIHIKKGIKFQDDPAFEGGKGRELKAQDFIYGWKRLFHPRMARARRAGFEDKISGITEFKKRLSLASQDQLEKEFLGPVEGLKVLDDYTLQIRLVFPYPQFLSMLALLPSAPIPHEMIRVYGHEGLYNHMIGTGPYILKSNLPKLKIILAKNRTFRGEVYEGKRFPFLDEIHFKVFREEAPAWLHFLQGDLDVFSLTESEFDTAIRGNELSPELKKKGIVLQEAARLGVYFLVFNLKHPFLKSHPLVRKAISMALDREEWIQTFQNGHAIKAASLIPKGIEGRSEKDSFGLEYNLEQAKRLLAQAGYPLGKGLPKIHFDTIAGTQTRQEAEFIARSLQKIGIQIEIRFDTLPMWMTRMQEGNLEVFSGTWVASYPDVECFLRLGYGPYRAPGANVSNWENPEFDRLFLEIIKMVPSEKRTRMISRAEEIFLNEAPMLPIYYPMDLILHQKWVKNYWPQNLMAFNALKYLDIDPNLKPGQSSAR